MGLSEYVIEVRVPYERAICNDGRHYRRRCVLGQTADGPGKRSYLHRFDGQRIGVAGSFYGHHLLQKSLDDLGQAYEQLMDKEGWQLKTGIRVWGPYPDYAGVTTSYHGQGPQGINPYAQAALIVAESGFNTDMVRYRLYGYFLGKGPELCQDFSDLPTSVPQEALFLSTP